jgi:hypothetical protein
MGGSGGERMLGQSTAKYDSEQHSSVFIIRQIRDARKGALSQPLGGVRAEAESDSCGGISRFDPMRQKRRQCQYFCDVEAQRR